MKQPTVLDSFALVSLFHREPGWEQVRSILRDLSSGGEKAVLCRINWGEFYYIVRRRVGKFNHLLIFSIFSPTRAASLVCLSSNVRNRSALIDKAKAT